MWKDWTFKYIISFHHHSNSVFGYSLLSTDEETDVKDAKSPGQGSTQSIRTQQSWNLNPSL